jgi:hypothetical protein
MRYDQLYAVPAHLVSVVRNDSFSKFKRKRLICKDRDYLRHFYKDNPLLLNF